jgi:hypothetical protein
MVVSINSFDESDLSKKKLFYNTLTLISALDWNQMISICKKQCKIEYLKWIYQSERKEIIKNRFS